MRCRAFSCGCCVYIMCSSSCVLFLAKQGTMECVFREQRKKKCLDSRFLFASGNIFPTGQTEQPEGRSRLQKLCTCGQTVNTGCYRSAENKKITFVLVEKKISRYLHSVWSLSLMRFNTRDFFCLFCFGDTAIGFQSIWTQVTECPSEWKCVGGTLEQVISVSLYKVISWQRSSVSV